MRIIKKAAGVMSGKPQCHLCLPYCDRFKFNIRQELDLFRDGYEIVSTWHQCDLRMFCCDLLLFISSFTSPVLPSSFHCY